MAMNPKSSVVESSPTTSPSTNFSKRNLRQTSNASTTSTASSSNGSYYSYASPRSTTKHNNNHTIIMNYNANSSSSSPTTAAPKQRKFGRRDSTNTWLNAPSSPVKPLSRKQQFLQQQQQQQPPTGNGNIIHQGNSGTNRYGQTNQQGSYTNGPANKNGSNNNNTTNSNGIAARRKSFVGGLTLKPTTPSNNNNNNHHPTNSFTANSNNSNTNKSNPYQRRLSMGGGGLLGHKQPSFKSKDAAKLAFQLSPILLKRLNRPVALLQAQVRRFLLQRHYQTTLRAALQELRRQRLAARRAAQERRKREKMQQKLAKRHRQAATAVQRLWRGILARIRTRQARYATVLQKHCRRFLTQRHLIVPQLQFQLRRIEHEKQRELLEIRQWQQDERHRLLQSSTKQRAQWATLATETASAVHATAALAHRLRQENKDFRLANETLRTDVLQLAQSNQKLVKATTKLQKSIDALEREEIPRLESENKKFTEVEKAFSKKLEEYQQGLQQGTDMLETETSVRTLYQLTAEELVALVVDKTQATKDAKLAQAIQQAVERDSKRAERALEEKTQRAKEGAQIRHQAAAAAAEQESSRSTVVTSSSRRKSLAKEESSRSVSRRKSLRKEESSRSVSRHKSLHKEESSRSVSRRKSLHREGSSRSVSSKQKSSRRQSMSSESRPKTSRRQSMSSESRPKASRRQSMSSSTKKMSSSSSSLSSPKPKKKDKVSKS